MEKNLPERSISDLHRFCAEKEYHINIIDINTGFVLIHKNMEEWI